ncbi:EAL domain-containing protein [Paraburkholderia sabiae]|uniref:Phosphodiesterase n=1 Tax=Paraburkholderia sabiae TaxID=273251 RepID=A0ABU9QLY0_9BURK|nr:phosphodiesterase [Paraburkholderia sabiae]WJZ77318.1 phosphodiesterase [Paraburkholderia sabiae]CAD6547903.1 hypothetical protein LMG24235_04502 [Paraburkholderia sabiae]
MPLRSSTTPASPSLDDLIVRGGLCAVFQPIVDFHDGAILGYEGLIRGPAGTALETPFALFTQANTERRVIELERAAARTCIDAFARLEFDGRLFINFSADTIRELAALTAQQHTRPWHAGIDPRRIVIELTEQGAISDVGSFLPALASLRASGAQFALDDYGTARATMNLWVQLKPDIVKIDRFFIHGVASDPLKFEAVRAMQHFAGASGAKLIAEGLETEADLTVARDIGIGYGQGYLLGRPAAQPQRKIAENIRRTVRASQIAVFPETARPGMTSLSGGVATAKLLVYAPALPRQATNDDVLAWFNRMSHLHALAVIEDNQPVALLNRRTFMDRYAQPFHRELFGKRSCLMFANTSPLLIEKSLNVQQMAEYLASDDQRYLTDGFVITDNGRYLGLGTGESLVRAVTEARIEAARYANPLTFLPGNIPISSHIERLLRNEGGFYACYVDLNHFKPFNDQYGYWKGDEVLKYAATVLADVCDPTRDFLGHVGGDDFLVLFQSDDWRERALRAIGSFNEGAQRFYALTDQIAGGIRGEDRRGNPTFYGFVTMAIGCVHVQFHGSSLPYNSEDIASAAALTKRRAKQDPSGFIVISIDEACASLPREADQAEADPFDRSTGTRSD